MIDCRVGCTSPTHSTRAAGGADPVGDVRTPAYPIVGITKSAPARMPVGQRVVMVLSRV